MTIRLIMYVMPWEIDDFDRVITLLKQSSYYIPENVDIKLDCCLNVSHDYFNWDVSKITKNYFVERYLQIQLKCNWFKEVNFRLSYDKELFGCLDLRRFCIREYNEDEYHIWLDSDMFFHPSLLTTIYETIKILNNTENEYFIITPEIIKYWDDSWDIIVNDTYLKEQHNFRDEFDVYALTEQKHNSIELRTLQTFKFGGGWFTCISNKLLKLIDLPDSFQSYGPDDTFIMMNCIYLKQYGVNVNQFLLHNCIVSEQSKKYTNNENIYKKYLTINHNKDELRQTVSNVFDIELKNNIEKFKNIFDIK